MKISILGTGAYGMAIASVLHYNKHSIKMWTNSNEEANYLNTNKKSPKVNYDIPSDIIISTNMKDVVSDSDVIIFATPSEFVSGVSKELSNYYNNQYIGITSKGIDNKSLVCLSDVVKMNISTDLIAVISGCTFASDMVRKSVLGINVASKNLNTLNVISDALKSFKCIGFSYENQKGEIADLKIQPYGIIYGEKTYLLGYNEAKKGLRYYLLHKIKEPKILNEYFDKDEQFSLKNYLSHSFGVYQEKPMKIKLLFSNEVKDAIKDYNLHPTQKMKQNPDGTTTVSLEAGGRYEICGTYSVGAKM